MDKIKIIAFMSILICLLIVIPAGFAMDNETGIGLSEENNQDTLVSDESGVLNANDYYFDASVENDTGDGSIDHPYKEFNSVRVHSNSIIHLADGEYNFNGSSNIYDVTIRGESSTNTIVKFAKFTASTSFTLYNVTLIGSSITNNGYLNAKNCIFINSTSDMYGGAINSNGNVNLDNCAFMNNSAIAGGAIYIKGGELSIKNSRFLDNNAELFGGAITSVRSNINLENVSFTNNKAGSEGGAIYSIYDDFSLYDSTFTNNTADNGAAVFVNAATVNVIVNNTFTRNNPLKRASLYSFYNSNSTIKNNTYSNEEDLCETFEINMFLGNGNYTLYWHNDTEISEIPSKYDLRELGYVTPVKSQGSDGNCWAFATMATLESCILKALGSEYDLSESNLKNLFGSYGDYGWTPETNTGGFASTGYNYLISWLGPVFESDDPYVLGTIFSKIMNSFMHVQNVLFLQRTSFTDNDEIKKALMNYGAVYTPIKASFDRNGKQYYTDGTKANHAIVIVGWDDDMVFNGAPGKGGWIIKNSWGDSWRKGGYGYVSYYDTSCVPIGKVDSVFTFILNDTIKFDKNYQYDIQGKSDFFLNSSSTVWYKNVFNATDNEYLAAVSTIFSNETDYEFSIYVNDELKITQNGHSKPGYYTFDLNRLIPLHIGDVFEIVFKIIVEGEAGVPVSEKVSFNKFYYRNNTSFISYDGENWTDFYELVWNYSTHTYKSQVACIKAFTVFDMVNTSTKLEFECGEDLFVKAIVLNQYNRPVNKGNVTFTINDQTVIVPVVNGVARYKIPSIGEYRITADYAYEDYYISSNDTIVRPNIIKTDVLINVSSIHNPVNISISVLNQFGSPVEGNVTVDLDGEIFDLTLTNGVANINRVFTEMGAHYISVSYDSNRDYYNSSSAQKSFDVSLIKTDLKLKIENGNNSINILANVIDGYGNNVTMGDLTFTLDGIDYTVDLNNASNFTYSFKHAGLNIIKAVYNGVENYYDSSSAALNVTLKTISASDEIKTLNSKYTFTVYDFYGKALNQSKVTVKIGSKNYNLISDENGTVILPIEVAPDKYSLIITNLNTSEVKTQTINVVKRITDNAGLIMYYGAGKYYKVKALDDDGNVASGVKVKFTINGKTYTVTTDSKGIASLKITQKPGTYTVTAEYNGFKVSNNVKVKTTLITKNKSFKRGKTIKFTAKLLSSKGKVLKSKKVTFKFKGKTYKVKTNKKGIATLKIAKKYKAGKYTITSKYGKLTVKNTIRIKK